MNSFFVEPLISNKPTENSKESREIPRTIHPGSPKSTFCFFKTGYHYVALASLELYVDQDNLDLKEIYPPLPPKCWDQRIAPPCLINCKALRY